MTAPPGGDYKKVSSLVALPDFLPGLGTLYVKPATLPAGPFLAYDRDGKLVSSVYMIPLKDIEAHKAFNGLVAAQEKVDHVDMYFNAGHPGGVRAPLPRGGLVRLAREGGGAQVGRKQCRHGAPSSRPAGSRSPASPCRGRARRRRWRSA